MTKPTGAAERRQPDGALQGTQVKGRISARALVVLTCRRCGADLLPILPQALLSGCPCLRTPSLRRIH